VDAPHVPELIHASGAVLWRGDPHSPEVALVHRDRYDDWSFPKGKLEPDEHVMTAAAREVREEAGARIVLGPPLPARDYVAGADRKHVDYWSARFLDGEFVPNDEVDEVRWSDLAKTRALLSHAGDRAVLDAFADQARPTVPIVLVRHAKAKSRSQWQDEDAIRPLTPRGGAQAQRFAEIMAGSYEPMTIVSSPWLRCMQSVSPYAALVGEPLAELDVLGEIEFEDDPELARDAVRHIIETTTAAGRGLVLCSHGNVMDTLVEEALHGRPGVARGLDTSPLAKGEFVVVHRATGTEAVPVGVERHRP
jgi:8-oxo-dGTP pyrophosphatase MutT (NUDIX family)/phosphohistidine phosphatase SixA